MLGKIVKVTVDRPLGTYHPKHKDIYYPINYGYVEGIIAPDGEEQDVYILGVDEPVKEYTGKVIAVIHRYDDSEEKWVVAPEDVLFTREEIMEQVRFQEQYFDSEVRMMDKQRYIDYAKRELLVENLETIYECGERAVYAATTLKYGDVIMKMNDDVYELMKEYTALKDMSGSNCAKVYNCFGGEMILEERIIPGNELREVVDTDARLAYFVETFNSIHKVPMNAKMYDTYLDWLNKAYEFCIGADVKPQLNEKMRKAKDIGEELFKKYPERVLLHGDLHHDNILLNKEGNYSIIDPKGVIGPKVFDIPRFVLNELDEDLNKTGKEHISYVISELSKKLNYDITDIKKLFFMETILANVWCVEDGEEIDDKAICIADEILREE